LDASAIYRPDYCEYFYGNRRQVAKPHRVGELADECRPETQFAGYDDRLFCVAEPDLWTELCAKPLFRFDAVHADSAV
jgi:hypothetical protein